MASADDLSNLSGDLYRHWEQGMTQWWDKVLESPAFLQGMGDTLTANSAARSQWEEQVDTTMANLHLPSRKDVVRLARIASLLEDRLLQLEDRLLSMEDSLQRIETETLKARVDAAEARLLVQERLTAMEARLPAPTPAPRRAPRTKKA